MKYLMLLKNEQANQQLARLLQHMRTGTDTFTQRKIYLRTGTHTYIHRREGTMKSQRHVVQRRAGWGGQVFWIQLPPHNSTITQILKTLESYKHVDCLLTPLAHMLTQGHDWHTRVMKACFEETRNMTNRKRRPDEPFHHYCLHSWNSSNPIAFKH